MCIVKMQTAHAPIYTLCQSAWVFESRDASPASISLWPCLWVLSLWGHLSTEVISQLVLPEWVHWLYSKSMQHESHVKWPTDTQCGLLSSEWLWWEPFREVGTRTLIKHWLGPWWKWSWPSLPSRPLLSPWLSLRQRSYCGSDKPSSVSLV